MPRRSDALRLPVVLAGLLVGLATLHVSTQSPQPTFRVNVDLTTLDVVRALLKKVTASLFHSGDMVAVVSTGPSSIAIPLTYDHALFTSAIGKVAGHGLRAPQQAPQPQ